MSARTLTYEQAAVLCRVPGMPYEARSNVTYKWQRGTHLNVLYPYRDYRLTPGAPLEPEQAAICLAMGVKVDVKIYGVWRRLRTVGMMVRFQRSEGFRVPPESE